VLERMRIPYNIELKEFARQNRLNPTLSEKLLWEKMKRKQINGYDFHRQKPLGDYIFDFYCFELKLLIECDGESHTHYETQKKDRYKEEYAKSIGFYVLRFDDVDVINNIDGVLKVIYDYIEDFENKNVF
jgi:very-short-patch-repair endonuclease